MKYINFLTTLLPEPQTFTPDPFVIFFTLSALTLGYVIMSIVLHPTIVFKMRKFGTNTERKINYTTRYDNLGIIYSFIPYLIYNKYYNAEFQCLENPTKEYGKFTLPFQVNTLRSAIDAEHLFLEHINTRADNEYIQAENIENRIQQLHRTNRRVGDNSWRDTEIFQSLVQESNALHSSIMGLNDEKCESLCYMRKLETLLLLYDPTYERKPTYDWEFE